MDAKLISFGHLRIDGHEVEHDVVVEGRKIRRRKKGPSKRYRDRYGHTPLSLDEMIPWSAHRLIVGTGQAGSLPIMPEVYEEARKRGVELIARPTAEACRLLREADPRKVSAILHVTC
jgi:hypothetical protein